MATAVSSSVSSLVAAAPTARGFELSTSRQHQNVSVRVSQFNGLRTCYKRQAAARKTAVAASFGFKIFAISAAPDTLETVQDVISKQLSIDLDTVKPETKFADLGADSLDTVEIMMALEEKFEISIGEGGAESIATVQDAADLIEKVKTEGA